MSQEIRFAPWLRQVAVVVGYFVIYQLLRSVSISYWSLQGGLRLGCVLLLPRRYWVALLLGDMMAAAPVAYQCFDQLGWGAAAAHFFPAVAFAMPPVWLLRKHLPEPLSGKRTFQSITAGNMFGVLVCAGVLALLTAIDGTIQFTLSTQPGSNDSLNTPSVWMGRYLLGHYTGCLTVVPLMLVIYNGISHAGSWSILGQRMARSQLLLEGVALGLASFVLLTALSAGAAGDMWRQVARMAMFLPVAWMAVRYGWQGAAAGSTAASVGMGIMLSMPVRYDPNTLLAQVIIVFVITILLPLGARIGALKEQWQDARRAATHDMLTGLPNRLLFHDRLRAAIKRASRHEIHFALAMLDLDGFKNVNDQHGHSVGDALLRAVAVRLRDTLRTNDSVARLGGDEFALILEDVSDVTALLERCQQLVAVLAMPYPLTGYRHGHLTIRVSASMGVTLSSNYDEEELIQTADITLHQAKKAGKNRCILADTTIKALPFVIRSQQLPRT